MNEPRDTVYEIYLLECSRSFIGHFNHDNNRDNISPRLARTTLLRTSFSEPITSPLNLSSDRRM